MSLDSEESERFKEDIRQFTFDGDRDYFDYRTYLSYLKNPKTFIFRYGRKFCKRIKEQYRINRILKEAVEQEKIRYQEERRERIALITRIREAVKGIDDEVAVITEAGNGTYDVFHMEPEILRNFLGVYPISTISGKEKRDLLKKYGKDKAWDITEIWKVGIRNRWLYEAEKSGISDAA